MGWIGYRIDIHASEIQISPLILISYFHSWSRPLFQHIVHSMKDPSIAAFWLLTMPQIVGGFNYDDEVKQKIWWQYKVYCSFPSFPYLFRHVILQIASFSCFYYFLQYQKSSGQPLNLKVICYDSRTLLPLEK